MTRTGILLIGVTVAIMAAAIAVFILPGKSVAPTGPSQTQTQLASIPGVIEVSAPAINATVSSPLVATGRAAGWYFEASFPVELRDQNNQIIAQGYAEAQGDWMTAEFVPFVTIPLTFPQQPTGSTGVLILRKDNPSGEPQFDQSLSVPVKF